MPARAHDLQHIQPSHKSLDMFLSFLQALERYNIEKDIAAFIKKEFDKKYNATWHCIVGRNFGMFNSYMFSAYTASGIVL